ncbi:MAG TPA: hypothetical protein VKE92_01890 [Anaerolineales bacterium]|nr:hypothetical protein [Anaerolineales bacterium]
MYSIGKQESISVVLRSGGTSTVNVWQILDADSDLVCKIVGVRDQAESLLKLLNVVNQPLENSWQN